MSGQHLSVKEVARGNSGFWWPDTKCLHCYLVSPLAWGTSSSCSIPGDIRKQLVLLRCSILPPSELLFHTIFVWGIFVLFSFKLQNPQKWNPRPVPFSRQMPGISGISNPNWNMVQQQHCFLSACKVSIHPHNMLANSSSSCCQLGSKMPAVLSPSPHTVARPKSPNPQSEVLSKTKLWSQRVIFPSSAASMYL